MLSRWESEVFKRLTISPTIPNNFPLSDPEKSVLSKSLNFVPLAKATDEFSVREDLKNSYVFFHDKSISNSSVKDVFQKLNNRKSKWTPPNGQFATVDYFHPKYDLFDPTLVV